MSTAAQVAANQKNSQHSTGPKTPEGKAAAAQNNLRHGLRGAFTLLPTEHPQEFADLLNALHTEHQPATTTERILVDRLAEHEWLSRRAQFFMDQTLTPQGTDNEKALMLWLRYQTTHDRGFHKCLADLLKLKNEKRQDQIGFERQKREGAENTRKQQIAEARIRALNAQASLKELPTKRKAMLQKPVSGNSTIPADELNPSFNSATGSCFQAQAEPGR